MIRVLHIIATLDPHGAERQLSLLVRNLDRTRFEPVVCCLTRGGPLKDEVRRAGIEVIHIGKRWKLDMTVVARLARLIRSGGFDVVQTWMFTSNAFGRAAAVLANAPVIIASERNADFWKTSVHFAVDRLLSHWTDAIACNAEGVREFVRPHVALPETRLRVIPNGIDPHRLQPARGREEVRKELDVPKRAALLCSAGRLSAPQKAFDKLIDTWAVLWDRRREFRGVIIGEGPEREALEAQIERLGLERQVRLLGFREDICDIIGASDAFVFLSNFEGMPNVVLEAMGLGVPVVASNVSGIDELIVNGETGIVVDFPLEPERIGTVVERVLDRPALARHLGQNACAFVRAEFSARRMAERYEALYEALCKHLTT